MLHRRNRMYREKPTDMVEQKHAMRRAIVFDGERWHVRRIRVIEHDLERDEKVYRCDQPISSDHLTLADVPEVRALLESK